MRNCPTCHQWLAWKWVGWRWLQVHKDGEHWCPTKHDALLAEHSDGEVS